MNSAEFRDRREWQKKAEEEGRVADSMEVRLALMDKFHKGEMTIAEVQDELKRIKRGAKKAGKITRDQAFRGR